MPEGPILTLRSPETAKVGQNAGVVDDNEAFIAAAKTRQWDQEKSVRTFALPSVGKEVIKSQRLETCRK